MKARKRVAALLGATLVAAVFAVSALAAPNDGARIPFANAGGIRDWEADHDRGLWVQDTHRRWYYASLRGPCVGLHFATTIAFDTHPMGTFDKFSSIIVRGGRCTVMTLEPSAAPPNRRS